MNCLRLIRISLLLFAGCQATVPTSPLPQRFNDLDPFRAVFDADFFIPPVQQQQFDVPNPPIALLSDSTHSEPGSSEIFEEEPSEEIAEDKIVFEPENVLPLSETEQAELLSQNQWIRNLALINWLDSGTRATLPEMSRAERQRQDAINRLNMSPQELAKRQHQQFEHVDGSVFDWRWMHRGVDTLGNIPPEQRMNLKLFLRDQYKGERILQANAVILMGRDGNPDAGRFLLQLVQSESTHVNIRCAAVEVLGRMPTITVDDLIPLLEQVKDREVETLNRQTGELVRRHQAGERSVWEELLLAIAEKIDPWEHECFLEPFYISASDFRLQTAKIWRRKSLQKQPAGTLPEQFLEIAKRESNPNVRVEIIKTLGSWQVPDLFTLLENDLQHRQAEVRNAAMLALADARHQEAIPMMRDRLRDAIGANRAAAASALRKLGVFEEVLKLVEDTDPQVRVEVARTFSERCTPQIAGFARSYIADRNQKVQLETIEAINGWSIEEAGPLLLMAAKSFHLEVRYRATEMLAQRGISSPDFNPEARPENQTEHYQELVQIFRESVGMEPMLDGNTNERSAENRSAIRQVSAITPDDATLAEVRRCLDDWSDRTQSPEQRHLIHRRLTAHGHRLMPMIDHLVITEKRTIPSSLDQVFAEIEPMFREIERLKSNDLSTRRRAAIELDRLGSVASPPQLAAKRMIDLAAREDDSIVLRSLLNALKNADPDSVCQLARPLLQSESAEVRRLSCEMLKQFGSSEDVPLLHDMLHDSSRAVVREALLAIDALLERDDAIDSSVLGTLKSMLISSDPMLQIDIAATLHRLGHSEGTDALRRLAVSNDHHIRTQIARTVSNLNDRAFVSLLLRYLEDSNATVRSEALKGLPKLAGQDIGRSGPFQSSDTSPTQQQIDRWKSWGKEWRE